MSWTYEQSTGKVYNAEGGLVAIGYSGCDAGKNNCDMQTVHNVGPIPVGTYTIGPPIDSIKHGPYALPLVPNPANEMFGRSGFMIHGDSRTAPGHASEGCLILDHGTRVTIWSSADLTLEVVAQMAPQVVT